MPITNRVDEQVVFIAGGLAPDILYLNPSFFGYFVRQGFLEDLQPYVARDGFPLDQLYPPLVAQMGDGDRLYAMPFELTSIAILYNESLFGEAGLPVPSSASGMTTRGTGLSFTGTQRGLPETWIMTGYQTVGEWASCWKRAGSDRLPVGLRKRRCRL